MQHLLRSIGNLFGQMANMIFTVGVLWCTWILGNQLFQFLQSGEWQAEPLLYYIGNKTNWEWSLIPSTWLGVHQLVNSLNAGFGVLLMALAISVTFSLLRILIQLRADSASYQG